MIKLGYKEYLLKNTNAEMFWKELDAITCGQRVNPTISYTPQYWGSFENVFGGRRKENSFSIYLYRPITRAFRTEILAKGLVTEKNGDTHISCSLEYPLYSFLVLFFLFPMFQLPFYAMSFFTGIFVSVMSILIFVVIILVNLNDLEKELDKQVRIIESKTQD